MSKLVVVNNKIEELNKVKSDFVEALLVRHKEDASFKEPSPMMKGQLGSILLSINTCKQAIATFKREGNAEKKEATIVIAKELANYANELSDMYLALFIEVSNMLEDKDGLAADNKEFLEQVQRELNENTEHMRAIGALLQLFVYDSEEGRLEGLILANGIHARFQFLLKDINGLQLETGYPTKPEEVIILIQGQTGTALPLPFVYAATMSDQLEAYAAGLGTLANKLATCRLAGELEAARMKLHESITKKSARCRETAQLYASFAKPSGGMAS